MNKKNYRAMIVRETHENRFERSVEDADFRFLPEGDVLVRVMYSSLNYKDALSASGNRGVTKKYPHTPGIDAAGVVEYSSCPEFKTGDEVIVTSYDLGMNTSGGFGQFIRVPAAWLVRKPSGLTLKESMIYGTAGFTAALSVLRLAEYGTDPDAGPVLVTGATGGVGSIAVSILKHSGYRVVALNGLKDEKQFLEELGVEKVIEPNDFIDKSGRPLLREQWAGCTDTVGGEILSTAIREIRAGGVITCCGNAASADISLTVYPFILRGVSLVGIDSQNCPMPVRVKVWEFLAGKWKLPGLERLCSEAGLSDLDVAIDNILAGRTKGRTVVRLWD